MVWLRFSLVGAVAAIKDEVCLALMPPISETVDAGFPAVTLPSTVEHFACVRAAPGRWVGARGPFRQAAAPPTGEVAFYLLMILCFPIPSRGGCRPNRGNSPGPPPTRGRAIDDRLAADSARSVRDGVRGGARRLTCRPLAQGSAGRAGKRSCRGRVALDAGRARPAPPRRQCLLAVRFAPGRIRPGGHHARMPLQPARRSIAHDGARRAPPALPSRLNLNPMPSRSASTRSWRKHCARSWGHGVRSPLDSAAPLRLAGRFTLLRHSKCASRRVPIRRKSCGHCIRPQPWASSREPRRICRHCTRGDAVWRCRRNSEHPSAFNGAPVCIWSSPSAGSGGPTAKSQCPQAAGSSMAAPSSENGANWGSNDAGSNKPSALTDEREFRGRTGA